MKELSKEHLLDEDTVMPAVPLYLRVLEDERAQKEIDHLGAGAIATDWGARIISNKSQLYDPLSYHNGSVWPLFTGWVSLGAYRYGRPHVGYQALMANASLTGAFALGYVTELLSGAFNTPFGRSSHHQIWSEAMVVTPTLRGLLGIEVTEGGGVLRFAPQLPVNWNNVAVRNVRAGAAAFDFTLKRTEGRQTITITRRELEKEAQGARRRSTQLQLAPAFPLDAHLRKVTVNGRATDFTTRQLGDRQFIEFAVNNALGTNEVIITYDEGTDVYLEQEALRPGASNQGLRILSSEPDEDTLHLTLEGLGGRTYYLKVLVPRPLAQVKGQPPKAAQTLEAQPLAVTFEGAPGVYVRRVLTIPLHAEE
jgi:hypothetical protein